MSVTAVGLAVALLTGAGWAALDATRKGLVARMDPTGATAWVNLAQAPLFVLWALLAGGAHVAPGYWAVGLGSVALQGVANVLLFRALAVSPLSATIPFLSLTPVFASLLGVFLLGELPSALQWVGIAVVVAGTLSVHAGGERGLLRSLRDEPGSLMTVGVAALWSLTTNLDRLALEHTSMAMHGAIQSGGVGCIVVAWMCARGRGSHLRLTSGARLPLAGAIVFSCIALALQLWAIQLLFVGLVETLKRAVGVTAAVGLGRLLFGEAVTPAKVAAIGLIVFGTALLVYG